MLQINSGKLYPNGVGRTNDLRGVLYSNLVLAGWGETPVVTAAGTLLPVESSEVPAPLVYGITERMESEGVTQGFLVSHGVQSYLQDFAAVAAFFFKAACSPDGDLCARLLAPGRASPSQHRPTSSSEAFLKDGQTTQISSRRVPHVSPQRMTL